MCVSLNPAGLRVCKSQHGADTGLRLYNPEAWACSVADAVQLMSSEVTRCQWVTAVGSSQYGEMHAMMFHSVKEHVSSHET